MLASHVHNLCGQYHFSRIYGVKPICNVYHPCGICNICDMHGLVSIIAHKLFMVMKCLVDNLYFTNGI
jgi:hypothetical protein